MVQTKKRSLIESLINTALGFGLSYFSWKFIVAPLIEQGYIEYDDSLIITVFFTVLSIGRNYIIRRLHTKR